MPCFPTPWSSAAARAPAARRSASQLLEMPGIGLNLRDVPAHDVAPVVLRKQLRPVVNRLEPLVVDGVDLRLQRIERQLPELGPLNPLQVTEQRGGPVDFVGKRGGEGNVDGFGYRRQGPAAQTVDVVLIQLKHVILPVLAGCEVRQHFAQQVGLQAPGGAAGPAPGVGLR